MSDTQPVTEIRLDLPDGVRLFRKKPAVIQAIQFTEESKDRCGNFVKGDYTAVFKDGKPAIEIHTLEGTMTAVIGDWIIKGVYGEFYPCHPHIFEATYEAVNE